MNKIKNLLIAVGIAIILPMFLVYGMDTFYPEPRYGDYCREEPRLLPTERTISEEECTEAGGAWVNQYCDYTFECREELNSARESHGKAAFIVLILLGLAVLVAGTLLRKLSAGAGFMAGGIITVIYSSSRYWRYAPKYLRLALLGLALAVLVYIAYMKSRK